MTEAEAPPILIHGVRIANASGDGGGSATPAPAGAGPRDADADAAGSARAASSMSILIRGGRIARLEPGGRRTNGVDAGAGAVRHFDGGGLLASIGLLDLQINGAAGHDLTSAPESLWDVGAALPRYGVTAFLPTLVSPGFDIVDGASAAFLAGPPPDYAGATPLGWHVEGPFLAPARAGAHDPASLRAPDREAVRRWTPARGIRMVTLAPELPGAMGIVRELSERGIVVSIGHSDATQVQAAAAFDAGARFVTHLFNAMGPLDHREPGLIGAALSDPRVTVGLIPDGLHVDPKMISLVRRVVGPDRLAIVTDAIAALGMLPGLHRLANREVIVDDASARLPDGVLAGSVLAMDQGVRNLASFCAIEPEAALVAATSVPARLLELPARGALAAGGVGDVTLFDANLAPVLTIVDGRVAFDAAEGSRWA